MFFLFFFLAIKHVLLVCGPLNISKHFKSSESLLLMYTQNNDGMPRDTPIHPHTLTPNHSQAEGSHTTMLVS